MTKNSFLHKVKLVLELGTFLFILLGPQAIDARAAEKAIYSNPIVYSDYSDPDLIASADGKGYYMTASSFHCTPGLPILYSEDLVNWEIVNYALDELIPSDFYDAEPRHGKGVWAPAIRHHAGKYYIYWGDPDFGVFMVSADDPRGEWSKPLLVHPAKGIIDTTPFWDEDGRAYLGFAWAASRSKFNSVLCVWEMTPDGTALIGKPRIVFDGNASGNHTCEGTKLFKRDGLYYILCPAGGVDKGWQLAMRSESIWGPYEEKIVLAQGSTDINGPHQGGLVDTPDGKSWFIHFQELQPWGRILHLNPVTWTDGWPIMGNNGEPVKKFAMPLPASPAHKIATSDNFDSGLPGLQWQWHGNYKPEFGMPVASGQMRIYGHLMPEGANLWTAPNMLLQKFHNPGFSATAKAKVTARDDKQQSGIIVMGRDYYRLAVQKQGSDFVVKLIECKEAESGAPEQVLATATLAEAAPRPAGLLPNYELPVWLRVKTDKDGMCQFYFSANGKKFTAIGPKVKAREGKWIGAKHGAYSVAQGSAERGWIDIDSYTVE